LKRSGFSKDAVQGRREKFGGRLRVMVSGGSALPAVVQDFLRVACHCEFIQGYGLTETTACSCTQIIGDLGHDNVGAPLPCCEAKLKSVENYSVHDNTGELWIRGPSVFPGYYGDEDATRAVFDDHGFFRTGDVFQLTPTRQLRIIARVKDVVKLAQGEYVSLQKLTTIYSTAKCVDQIYIHAGMTSRFLVAIIVVPDQNAGLTKEQIIAELAKVAKENRLNGFERINDVFVTTEQFTTANGLMTPSLKVCAFAVERRYKHELERLNQ
jgi:long-chain acyl-CoA synthetase